MTTLQGTVMGTPAFMSPEQINAGTVDTRTDIWSLGVLFYHLVTGALPFAEADAIMASLMLVLTSPATPPSRHLPDIPPPIERLILRCLEKRPQDRPASVAEVAAVLVPYAAGTAAPSVPPPAALSSPPPAAAQPITLSPPAPLAGPSPPAAVPLDTDPPRLHAIAPPRPPHDNVILTIALSVAAVILLLALALLFGTVPPIEGQAAPVRTARPATPAPTTTPRDAPASLAPPAKRP